MNDVVRMSKFLSLVLRHKPQQIGLRLDVSGWADVNELISLVNKTGRKLTLEALKEVVEKDDKQRYAFNDDGMKIRANQGHSIDVNLDLKPVEPPETLYHGTAKHFLDSIKEKGLVKGSRQYVHLSLKYDTAIKVGSRHGDPVVLLVRARDMHKNGMNFYLSANGVWLTDYVPVEFLL